MPFLSGYAENVRGAACTPSPAPDKLGPAFEAEIIAEPLELVTRIFTLTPVMTGVVIDWATLPEINIESPTLYEELSVVMLSGEEGAAW